MDTTTSTSITIEDAVAEMVNMNYIPAGFTLLEMLEAFYDEAEFDYENARIDQLPVEQLAPLKIRLEACNTRLTLSELLMESLQHEVDSPEGSSIVLADDYRLTLESVSDWAIDRFGIGVPRWVSGPASVSKRVKNIPWESVTIKIWEGYKIGYSFTKGRFKRTNFQEIDLMGKAKNSPNKIGGILIGLSKGYIFKIDNLSRSKEKVSISRLRDALCMLTGLSGEPFKPYNQSDGWVPRFKLIYDVNNADKRAKKKAILKDVDKLSRRDLAKLVADSNIEDDLIDSIDSSYSDQ
jgi:hypothetical protein